MIIKKESTIEPEKIVVSDLPECMFLYYLRDNIEKNDGVFSYDEVYFHSPATIDMVRDMWAFFWNMGVEWTDIEIKTDSERISELEESLKETQSLLAELYNKVE